MSSNQDYSKKILKILAENRAVSLPDLVEKMNPIDSPIAPKERYALNRSLRNLRESGLIESHFSGQNDYARLTAAGRKKAVSHKLEAKDTLVPNWDRQWRIIILDLPEDRKQEREALRYLLKKAGFVCLKNSVWVSPYPFEHLFINIKHDLGLSTEIMILVTHNIDNETEQELMKVFGK